MTEPSWQGRHLTVEIGRVAHGGHCVARHEGRVIFVRHALPGERVRVVVTEDRGGSFVRADAVDVLSPSESRVQPPCRFAHPGGCGGCDWQHADPAAQRALKADVVREQLQRLAGLDAEVDVEAIEPTPLHWRTRMQYAVRDGAVGLRAHRSHDVVDIDTCLIAVPDADVPTAGPAARAATRSIEVETGDNARPTVSVVDARGRRRVVSGGPQRHRVRGRTFEVRSGGFWQVHERAAEVLTDAVLEMAQARPGESVIDLFCGVGLFTAALGEQVGVSGRVRGYEGVASAVRDGVRNVADQPQCQISRAAIDAATVRAIDGPIDVVVLDPPRTGAKQPLVDAICDLSPRAVVYVACDPAALARDVGSFQGRGWRLERVRAFDLFPMTHHVECVALLLPG